MSNAGMSKDQENLTGDSGVIAHDVKASVLEDKVYQPKSN